MECSVQKIKRRKIRRRVEQQHPDRNKSQSSRSEFFKQSAFSSGRKVIYSANIRSFLLICMANVVNWQIDG